MKSVTRTHARVWFTTPRPSQCRWCRRGKLDMTAAAVNTRHSRQSVHTAGTPCSPQRPYTPCMFSPPSASRSPSTFLSSAPNLDTPTMPTIINGHFAKHTATAHLCWRQDYVFLCRTSFNNGWTDRNAECCVNTVNEKLLRLRIWWTLVKGRCHGNQSFGLRRRKLTHPRLHFVRWHFTTVKKITRKTCNTRRHLMNPLHLVKILWTFVQ